MALQWVFNCMFVFMETEMKRVYHSKHIFEFKLQFYKDVVDLHDKLLNIFSLICYSSGYYYCLYSKYEGCEKKTVTLDVIYAYSAR